MFTMRGWQAVIAVEVIWLRSALRIARNNVAFIEGLEQARNGIGFAHHFSGLLIIAAAYQNYRQTPSCGGETSGIVQSRSFPACRHPADRHAWPDGNWLARNLPHFENPGR